MTNKLPEALRLADALSFATCHDDQSIVADEAAALLRTQHALLERAREALKYMHDEKCDYMRRNNLGDPLREDAARLAVPALAALNQHLDQK